MRWTPLTQQYHNAPIGIRNESYQSGLDIVKCVYYVYTIKSDKKVFKKMLRRKQVLEFFANYSGSLMIVA